MKSQEEMEMIMNATYPGLRLLYRDARLRRTGDVYKPGMLLRDDRAIEASLLPGGPLDTYRYAILSNHFKDDSKTDFGLDLGLCTIAAGAHFKVLDIYKRLGRTQITLLHLPNEHWRFFEGVSTNVDDLLVEYTRNRFDECIDTEPVQALDDEAWRMRCCHPIGMTDLGLLLPLEDDAV